PTGLKLLLEPGRSIVGPCGALVTKVLYVKRTPKKKFVVVDAAMNDLIRPSLYGAYHPVVPVRATEGAREVVDIVGPICESGDFFATDRALEPVKAGDLLSIGCAGAYGATMSSHYNARPKLPEILVEADRATLVSR